MTKYVHIYAFDVTMYSMIYKKWTIRWYRRSEALTCGNAICVLVVHGAPWEAGWWGTQPCHLFRPNGVRSSPKRGTWDVCKCQDEVIAEKLFLGLSSRLRSRTFFEASPQKGCTHDMRVRSTNGSLPTLALRSTQI